MGEKEPETKNASEQDRHREPCAVEKFVEQPTVGSNHALDKIGREPLHPGAFVSCFPLTQDTRAHQRSKRQRYKTRGENGDYNCNGEFPENAAKQSRQENQRDENRGKRQRHR